MACLLLRDDISSQLATACSMHLAIAGNFTSCDRRGRNTANEGNHAAHSLPQTSSWSQIDPTYRANRSMAEASLEAGHTTGQNTTQTVGVERTTPNCLNFVLQDGGHLVTAQVGDSYR